MWKAFLVLIVLTSCSFGTRVAEAASFEAKDFSALATEADQIVIGTVATTSARRTGAREIVTDYRFDKLEVVKGTVSNSSLTLTMLGGSVGNDKLSVVGAPTFKRGARYLVFVTGNGTVMFPLVGGDQGIFQIRGDPLSGVPRVHDYAGRAVTRLPDRAIISELSLQNEGPGEPMSQTAFVDAIRAKVIERSTR